MKKVIKYIWLFFCAAVLAFAYIQRNIPDVDIAFLWFMLILTFPLGYVFTFIVGLVFSALYTSYEIVVPGGLLHNAIIWLCLVLLGYWEYFVLPEWVLHKWRKSSYPCNSVDAKTAAALWFCHH